MNALNFTPISKGDFDEMVKDINDKELTAQWQKFTDSQTEKEAQDETIKLLKLLAEKMG